MIRFGEESGRVTLSGERAGVPLELEVTVRAGEGKQARLNGARLQSSEQLRAEVATLVFTPDRLTVIKGGPHVRRVYLDRALGRLFPARVSLPGEYGTALAQRNIALRRVVAGLSLHAALTPWTEQCAMVGAELVAARREVLELLGPGFVERAGKLGLPDAQLEYAGEPPTVEALAARLERDLERGATGLGPHLDDVAIRSGERELRSYGSQGEQRVAVLALLFAEAELISQRQDAPPLLLLDDVLSELDPERCRILAGWMAPAGQALITATTRSALPIDPAQVVDVTPGGARVRR